MKHEETAIWTYFHMHRYYHPMSVLLSNLQVEWEFPFFASLWRVVRWALLLFSCFLCCYSPLPETSHLVLRVLIQVGNSLSVSLFLSVCCGCWSNLIGTLLPMLCNRGAWEPFEILFLQHQVPPVALLKMGICSSYFQTRTPPFQHVPLC